MLLYDITNAKVQYSFKSTSPGSKDAHKTEVFLFVLLNFEKYKTRMQKYSISGYLRKSKVQKYKKYNSKSG